MLSPVLQPLPESLQPWPDTIYWSLPYAPRILQALQLPESLAEPMAGSLAEPLTHWQVPESLTEPLTHWQNQWQVPESLTQSLLPAQLHAQSSLLPAQLLAELEGEALVKLWRLLVGDVVEVVGLGMFDCVANHQPTVSLHSLPLVCSSLQSTEGCNHSIGSCVDGAQLLLQLA